ncbi:MAG: sulfur transferase domain-containing protein [Pseudohongiellaceae bacterium]
MKIHQVSDQFSYSSQVSEADLAQLKEAGVEILVCNRPDAEAADQPEYTSLARAAEALGMEAHLIAFKSGHLEPGHRDQFKPLLAGGKRIHAFCRTGNRSFNLYAAAAADLGVDHDTLRAQAREAGFDIGPLLDGAQQQAAQAPRETATTGVEGAKSSFDVVIVGAGSGGVALASSLKRRNSRLRINLIDPASDHYYQPGWTMVGGGVFDASSTRRRMADLIPKGVVWTQQAVTGFNTAANEVVLNDDSVVHYKQLVVAPGLVLNWSAIEGLTETLGSNGVTSNYRYDLAPYTWELVQNLKSGKAFFTQPAMPIKCAGAPQKAMYLSCHHWRKSGVLDSVDVHFLNAGGVLFGVKDYVPALQSYIERYGISTHYSHTLKSVDGAAKVARFEKASGDDASETLEMEFDMMHVCPPQCAPDFVARSELADAAGWLDVDQFTLRHKQVANIWGLGDVMSAPNAKTMAAVRKQVPVVAENLLAVMEGREPAFGYDGYGSCPLTVERGKIVLAEFGYGGKLLPTFPTWLINGTQPSRAAWTLKKDILPGVYWNMMLKGREWMAGAQPLEKVKS